MNTIEVLFTVISVISIFAIPFVFFAFVRYLRYKETIALAERGLLRPERPRRNMDLLRWGIVIMIVGVGLTCGLWPLGFLITSSDAAPVPAIAEGTAASAGETAAIPIVTDGGSLSPFGVSPWMILGILPIFFGLALIAIYWINKREGIENGGDEAISPHKRVEQDEI